MANIRSIPITCIRIIFILSSLSLPSSTTIRYCSMGTSRTTASLTKRRRQRHCLHCYRWKRHYQFHWLRLVSVMPNQVQNTGDYKHPPVCGWVLIPLYMYVYTHMVHFFAWMSFTLIFIQPSFLHDFLLANNLPAPLLPGWWFSWFPWTLRSFIHLTTRR